MITDAQYALDLCTRIAAHTDVPGAITRTFLSPATRAVHALLTTEMQSLGMTVRTDSVGNLRGIYPATNSTPDTQTLLLGSHIDTVPNAGPYDGILGVAIPLALIRSLAGARLPYAIEIIAFSEEEGVRFKMSFLGSRALFGQLGPEDLARIDSDGITIAQAIRDFGLNSDALTTPDSDALITPNTFAFLEVHIEQGPILESLALPLGVVETIVGQARFELTLTGQANHAGTTPMPLRRDALAAAALFITAAETFARNTPPLVATVGILHAHPGAANVIPGSVTCSLDIRHPDDDLRDLHTQGLLAEAATLAESRGVTFTARQTSAQASVRLDANLRARLTAAANNLHPMNSGAGHDAMILAPHIPAAMLFLRTPGGLSHHPDESVSLEDVQAALQTCLTFLHALS